MTNSIDDLINAAQQNAANTVETPQANLPAVQSQNTAVAQVGAAPVLTLEDMAAGAMSVDAFLKMSYHGFTVGDDAALFDTARVRIVAEEIVPHRAVRKTVGGSTQYAKSIDGVREVRSGRPWKEVIAEYMRADPKCTGDYAAADVPMTLLQDLVDPKTKRVVIETGKRVAYTTPITGTKVFNDFNKKVLLKRSKDTPIVGNIVHEPKNKDSFKWGILNFGAPESWVAADELAEAA